MILGGSPAKFHSQESMDVGPPHVIGNICVNAELINTPLLGAENNIAHLTAQLNITPAQSPNSGMFLIYDIIDISLTISTA